MAAIELTSRDIAVRGSPASRALTRAATAALAASSIFNTQPHGNTPAWRWRIDGGIAELWAGRRRPSRAMHDQSRDPHGRLLALSAGAALHHARVALAADGYGHGYGHAVARTPDPERPDLLALIEVDGSAMRQAAPEVMRMYRAMSTRRTERRSFADLPVPAASLDRLRSAADANGAHLKFPCSESTSHLRRGILVAAGDSASGWLAAGEALSAVLLTATADGLAVAPAWDEVGPQTITIHVGGLAGMSLPALVGAE